MKCSQLLTALVMFTAASTASFVASAQQSASSVGAPASSPEADNSKMNMRDRADSAVTPMTQSNDPADIKLLAAVRRAIVDDKSLSTKAHNVKVMVANGVVTLRGPVDNAKEKVKVAALVADVSGVSRVDNQLDVKTETHSP
jgi:osmotically-inducible protein OsmY